MAYVKHLVSKKKRRYKEDGFDLDLAYIKPNIVAMGFPSENLEGVYRNNIDDVVEFLEHKHSGKYRVYNLCSEKFYDPSKFNNRVASFGFDDHNAPPFELMEPCCRDIDDWLSKEENNVAIIHCKAGKGRTGVMICAYLMYKRLYTTPEEAMEHYAKARTENEKGVTIPSQRRYITYFGYYVSNSLRYKQRTVLLNSITFVGTPSFTSGSCCPSFVIYQTKVILFKTKTYEIRKSDTDSTVLHLDRPIPICGDIKIDFFHHKDRFRKERMFVFWFNTYFLEHGVTLNHPEGGGTTTTGRVSSGDEHRTYELTRLELDKANKDKRNKFFPEGFKIQLNFTVPASKESPENVKLPTTMSLDRITDATDRVNQASGNLRTLSMKDTPPVKAARNTNAHTGSPNNLRRTQQPLYTGGSELETTVLSRSEIDLSSEPLSDDDEDEDVENCNSHK